MVTSFAPPQALPYINLASRLGNTSGDVAGPINALLASLAGSGATVVVPRLAAPYLVSVPIVMQSGVNLIGQGNPVFQPSAANGRLLTGASLSNFSIAGITLDANNIGTGSHNPFLLTDCNTFSLTDLVVMNSPSYCRIEGNSYAWKVKGLSLYRMTVLHGLQIKSTLDVNGNIISAPHDWVVTDVYGEDVAGTLVYPHSGAYNGSVLNVTKRRGASNIGGGEALGINYLCHDITFDNIKCFDGADNGVSLTGYNLSGGTIISNRCAHAACYIYGHHNAVASVIAIDCGQQFTTDASIWAGVQFASGFGGLCFDNTVASVVAYNTPGNSTQAYGVLMSGGAYTQWVASATVAASAYVYNGLNLYLYATGGTSGSTGPTHTSGTVADGTATLTFVSSFVASTQAQQNTVGAMNAYNNRLFDYLDQTGLSNSIHARNAWYDDFWQYENGDIMAHGANRRIRRLSSFWASAEVVTYGTFRQRTGRTYIVSNAGGTCTVSPTHTSGTVTGADGVAWSFVQAEDSTRNIEVQSSDTIFGVRIRLNHPTIQTVQPMICIAQSAPEGLVTAPAGSLCLVSPDGNATSSMYFKVSGTGNTGWVVK